MTRPAKHYGAHLRMRRSVICKTLDGSMVAGQKIGLAWAECLSLGKIRAPTTTTHVVVRAKMHAKCNVENMYLSASLRRKSQNIKKESQRGGYTRPWLAWLMCGDPTSEWSLHYVHASDSRLPIYTKLPSIPGFEQVWSNMHNPCWLALAPSEEQSLPKPSAKISSPIAAQSAGDGSSFHLDLVCNPSTWRKVTTALRITCS